MGGECSHHCVSISAEGEAFPRMTFKIVLKTVFLHAMASVEFVLLN